METPTLLVAFLAGLISFLSPCVLPLVPAYIGYLSGPAVMAAASTSTAARRSKPMPAGGPTGAPERNGEAPASASTSVTRSNGEASPTGARPVSRSNGQSSTAASSTASREGGGVAVAALPARRAPSTGTGTARAASPRPAPLVSASSARWKIFAHSLLFVLGFTIIFVVVIGGLAGQFSDLLKEHRREVQIIMGGMLVVFGLFMLHIINIPLLNYTRRADTAMRTNTRNFGYIGSLLIGMGFAIGWTPCIGPTLGLMFTLALNNRQAQAFPLFLAYSLGLGIPFLITGLAMGQVSSGLKRLTRRTYSLKLGGWKIIDRVDIISAISGVLLIVVGILVFNNWMTLLNQISPIFNI
ncbi:MAG: cytochrome c biogenesis CcdA family protein [Chloroflexia bacterium]